MDLDTATALLQRFDIVLARVQQLETALAGQGPALGPKVTLGRPEGHTEASLSEPQQGSQQPSDRGAQPAELVSLTQHKLTAELQSKGVSQFRFVRVPAGYYEQDLEFRRQFVGAHSIHHLCKSIVMENTRAHPSTVDWQDPNNSKYYLVIVQYSARLHAEKLKRFIHKLNNGKVGIKYFNMRLAPEEVSDALTGWSHNAVTPVCLKCPLPIIMSHRIIELSPEEFFLGAGETDLKLGLPVSAFEQAYQPLVIDCTYD